MYISATCCLRKSRWAHNNVKLHFYIYNSYVFWNFYRDYHLYIALFQPGEENVAFKELTDQLNKISYAGDKISVTKGFDPTALLPGKISHYSYRCFKKPNLFTKLSLFALQWTSKSSDSGSGKSLTYDNILIHICQQIVCWVELSFWSVGTHR